MIQTPSEVVYKAFSVFTVQRKFTAGDYELQTAKTQTQTEKMEFYDFGYWTSWT